MPGPVLVLLIIVGAIVLVLATYLVVSSWYRRRFREWQAAEALRWAGDRQKAIKAAVTKSRAVLGGKFTEQMAPFLPEFSYGPTGARFIGSPVDFLVFPGLATGEPQEIIIMEIKSGNSALSPQEKKIQSLVENGMVRWELVRRAVEPGPKTAE